MNYRWLDPLGRVRRQPHWCSHFRVDGSYVSVRLRFEKSSPRWRIVGRERGSRGSRRRQGSQDKEENDRQQQIPVDRYAPTCTGNHGRPRDRPQKMKGRPPGRPTDMALLSGWSGRPARSTGRSTDSRIFPEFRKLF